jgi:hypothetical protein
MLGAQGGATPTAAGAPLTITLYAEKSEVPVGSPIGYNVVIANNTNHTVECSYSLEAPWTSSDEMGTKALYALEITDVSGKGIFHKPVQVWQGSVHRCTVEPGTTKGWGTGLNPSDYPGLVPGEYKIRISAKNPDDSGGARLYSNSVSVRILASTSKQAPN